MKRLFSLLVLALSFSAIFAQQTTVALLNHEGTITTYYGSEALVQAHKAAVDGDVITLSGGSFTAPSSWTKAVTLRGAGCFAGEDNSREVTSIGNDFVLDVPNTIETTSIFEGICFKSKFTMGRNSSGGYLTYVPQNTTFLKCYFMGSLSGVCANTNFYNCICSSINFTSSAKYLANIKMFNCYVQNPGNPTSYTSVSMTNCIIRYSSTSGGNTLTSEYITYKNCIFLGNINVNKSNNPISYNIPSTSIATNCLSCYCAYKNATETTDAIYDYNIFDNMGNATNSYLEEGKPISETIKSVFKTYNGTDGFSFNELYELTDEAKTKYIGTDGTQVGLHGGMGFDLVPSTLQITKCEVAPRSTTDGKLSVSIEVGIPE